MPYTFQNSPGKLTQDLNKAFGKTLLEEFNRIGLKINITEWSILSFLSHKKICTQKQISEFLGLEKVFVKRTLDRMEKNGWINRSQGKEDKRYNKLFQKSKLCKTSPKRC
ncbi:MAG: MarR family winged helix-turn-helix transcriptional regulator [Bacteroidales bacterium]